MGNESSVPLCSANSSTVNNFCIKLTKKKIFEISKHKKEQGKKKGKTRWKTCEELNFRRKATRATISVNPKKEEVINFFAGNAIFPVPRFELNFWFR